MTKNGFDSCSLLGRSSFDRTMRIALQPARILADSLMLRGCCVYSLSTDLWSDSLSWPELENNKPGSEVPCEIEAVTSITAGGRTS